MSEQSQHRSFKQIVRDALLISPHDSVNNKNVTFYDKMLVSFIVLSILIVLLDSIESFHLQYKGFFNACEWFFVVIFTIEYFLRVYSAYSRWKYVFSFYGIVDFIAVFPSYFILFFSGTTSLFVIRAFRLLRIFRIFKLLRYLEAVKVLVFVLRESRTKIIVFLTTVTIFVTFMGAVMFFIEGKEHGFTSIPRSIYWSIVTVTTVGYGDITPQTTLGQLVASCLMIASYGIIAIPTGIISSSFIKYQASQLICPRCQTSFHDNDARYCKLCGTGLRPIIIAKSQSH